MRISRKGARASLPRAFSVKRNSVVGEEDQMEVLKHFCAGLRGKLMQEGSLSGDPMDVAKHVMELRDNLPQVVQHYRKSWLSMPVSIAFEFEIACAISIGNDKAAAQLMRMYQSVVALGGANYLSLERATLLLNMLLKANAQSNGDAVPRFQSPGLPNDAGLQLFKAISESKKMDEIRVEACKNIENQGWAIVDDFVPRDYFEDTATEFLSFITENVKSFEPGEVDQTGRPDYRVRGDDIMWFDCVDGKFSRVSAVAQAIRDRVLVEIRDPMRKFGINLTDVNAAIGQTMLAVYKPGMPGFTKHRDYSGPQDPRGITAVYYITNLENDDGGQLLIHGSKDSDKPVVVQAKANRLVLFDSKYIEHEVAPVEPDVEVERVALSYWFIKDLEGRQPRQKPSPVQSKKKGQQKGKGVGGMEDDEKFMKDHAKFIKDNDEKITPFMMKRESPLAEQAEKLCFDECVELTKDW